MNTRNNHYVIQIVFSDFCHLNKLGYIKSKYISKGHSFFDEVEVDRNSIVIRASRSHKVDISQFWQGKNSLYSRLMMGLVYFYAISDKAPTIERITVERHLRGQERPEVIWSGDRNALIQPFHSKKTMPYVISPSSIEKLFDETNEKGQTIMISLSYWLKAFYSTDRFYRFEHLWRAFNKLYKYEGNNNRNELECLKAIRKFIVDNEGLFKGSIRVAKGYCDDLRSFRWRSMILNDYDTKDKTEAFRDFVLRYSDSRIMTLISEMLTYREKYLSELKYLDTVKNHIKDNFATQHEIELVTLICIKYTYFVRNKSFHGEVFDSTFKIHETVEDKELDRLNDLLEVLVYELIESNDKMR